MAGFSVNIGANTVQLTRTLGELQKDLVFLKKQLQSTTDPQTVVKLNQAIAQTDKQIKGITSAQNIKAIGRDMKELPAGFDSASFAVGNFSRVVQDVPFSLLSGNLIAVSNNADPLVHSFVTLYKQTGSVGAAFKALGGSLIGSGGLLLGFSLVNAAITYFSAQSLYGKKSTDELADSVKSAAEIEREAAGSVQGTAAQVRNLANVVLQTNRSYEERVRALKELQQINKSYFGDLTLEANSLKLLKERVEEYTQALVNEAIVKRYADAIADLAVKVSEQEDAYKKATDASAAANKNLQEAEIIAKGVAKQDDFLALARKRSADASAKARTEGEKLTDLETQELLLMNKLNAAQQAGLKLRDLGNTAGGKETDALKKRISALKELESTAGLDRVQRTELVQLEVDLLRRDGIKLGFTKEEIEQQVDALIEKSLPDTIITSRFKVHVLGDLNSTEVKRDLEDIDVAGAFGLDKIDPEVFDPLIKKMQDASAAKAELLKTTQAEKLGQFIAGTLTPAFDQFFNSLLSGGQDFAKSFVRLIGDIVKRMVQAIATAAALAGILSAFGIPLGGAKGFSAIFGKITGFATGGIATRPTLGVFGEAGPEAVIPLARLPQILGQLNQGGGAETLQAIVRGDDLLFILNRTQRKQGRIL